VLVTPRLVFGLFTSDLQVAAAAAEVALLAVVAMVPLIFAVNPGGVLRAADDTRTVLVASVAGDAFLVPWPGSWPSTSSWACAASCSPGWLRPGLPRRQLVALPKRQLAHEHGVRISTAT
jgi:hypothetical protein